MNMERLSDEFADSLISLLSETALGSKDLKLRIVIGFSLLFLGVKWVLVFVPEASRGRRQTCRSGAFSLMARQT